MEISILFLRLLKKKTKHILEVINFGGAESCAEMAHLPGFDFVLMVILKNAFIAQT